MLLKNLNNGIYNDFQGNQQNVFNEIQNIKIAQNDLEI